MSGLGVLHSEVQKMEKQKLDKDAILNKVVKAQEELLKISQCLILVKSAMKTASDNFIMAMYLTGMNDESRVFWREKKKDDFRFPRFFFHFFSSMIFCFQ